MQESYEICIFKLRFALWNIFPTINGIARLESTTWNNLKEAGIGEAGYSTTGCRAGASTQRLIIIATVQGYGWYSGSTFDNSQFPFSHLRFHN